MKFVDMLSMSVVNLFKRKLRTILTVLGVVIGVASIVVMVSLGLGLSKLTMEEMQQYASLTEIEVNAPWDSGNSKKPLRLNDELVETLSQLDHVEYVSPMLEISIMAKRGAYTGYLQLRGVPHEYLVDQKIDIGQGRLPDPDSQTLELFMGNMIPMQFNSKSGRGYWETGELPDIDFMNDSIMYILDTDRYYSYQSGAVDDNGSPVPAPKKHLYPVSGMAAGSVEDYHTYSYYVYCDIEALKRELKKEFKNRAIPNQPTTSKGKPYKEIFYSEIIVQCDDMENVSEVTKIIQDMGYNAYNDAEWIKQNQQQMQMIEVVLGGIGAVSLLVAAIGIANTMMMSIYERTKEIGVMKVLGCDMHNIQAMFLIEAGFIGFFGGIIGIGLSYILSIVINKLVGSSGALGMSGNISYIPFWLTGLSLIFAILVGMVSGFFPSRRAMKLSPLAAIRNDG
ncbi:MAG: ABC transporter permease [Lachnospiraceae bacterium]|nr:ABC transporter permease [Lachnospiraceae bacterium]